MLLLQSRIVSAVIALCILPFMVLSQDQDSSNATAQLFSPELNALRTLSVGFVVFPGFDVLDVFGTLEILTQLSFFYKISLSVIAAAPGPVRSGSPPWGSNASSIPVDFGYVLSPSIEATHSFYDAPGLDILYVPGGFGVITIDQKNDTSVQDFINSRFQALEYLVGVSYGVTLLAKAGVLKGKKATTNKSGWDWITTGRGENITWVPQARWVEDGKVWTTSGMVSGLDATYSLWSRIYGTKTINYLLDYMEYAPHLNPEWDPYAALFNVTGSDGNSTRTDCVGPVPFGTG